jgi:signal transduction histidine kinase
VADGKEPGSVRVTSVRPARPIDLRRQIERLDGLPIRPTSARVTLDARPPEPIADDPDTRPLPAHPATELDPGWILGRLREPGPEPIDPLAIVAGRPWWRPTTVAGAEAISRLWRHAVAVSLAARRLAREANDPEPGLVGRAGILHQLGLWAIAAIDPERLAYWMAAPDPERRRELEQLWLGTDVGSLGRTLAARWGCDPLIVDAAWLHADASGDLAACADDPARLELIRQAFARAEKTPWALAGPPTRDPGPLDPRIRLLMAEVQARCCGDFVEADATVREERLSRENAALRLEAARLRGERDGRDRLIAALAESDTTERPEVWAERAGLAWCDAPGVAAARVVWLDVTAATEPKPEAMGDIPRQASTVLTLGDPTRPSAEVHLWTVDPAPTSWHGLEAWGAWAELVADNSRLRRKLDEAVAAFRRRVAGEDAQRRTAKLAALAEFAAGAGHEINNPLAVILGRAQLLLTRAEDVETVRSLRAIVTQAQRAHRILRDLMYFARPPETHPRLCSADEVLRGSLRDAQAEADARGIRLVGDQRPPAHARVWTDPEPLRHVADILVRNALEATPAGGTVFAVSAGDEQTLRWTIKDSGRGLSAQEAAHMFDPFFCGRQAGRGLGLGLSRAARIAQRAGGEITWQSVPGQGTSFQFRLPLDPPPAATPEGGVAPALQNERAKSA